LESDPKDESFKAANSVSISAATKLVPKKSRIHNPDCQGVVSMSAATMLVPKVQPEISRDHACAEGTTGN
jgi:hypothetical protein